LQLENQRFVNRCQLLADELNHFFLQDRPDYVYWVERSGKAHKNLSLNAAPIDVAEFLRQRLFESDTSIIMTSATLATSVLPTSRRQNQSESTRPAGKMPALPGNCHHIM
jgi:Rad3-related DNA helicase